MPKPTPSIDLGALQGAFSTAKRTARASAKRLALAEELHSNNCESLEEARLALSAGSRALLARSEG